MDELRQVFGDVEVEERPGHDYVRIPAEGRPQALAVLKTAGFTFYNFCGAVDWPDDARFDVLDQVYDWTAGRRVTARYSIPRESPRIPTGTAVFRGANWYERETAELFGIVFVGHPNPVRLFLPDWEEGYPLRKDYVLRARIEKPWPGAFFEG